MNHLIISCCTWLGASWLLACGSGPAQGSPADKPPALLACEEARKAIRTAEVWWSGSSTVSDRAPGVAFGRCTLLAHDDLIELDLGNQDGVTGYSEDGQPVSLRTKELFNEEMRVQYTMGDTYAKVYPEYEFQPSFTDVRALGLLPVQVKAHQDISEILWTYPPGDESPRTYEQEFKDGLYDVTMRLESGAAVRWLIDPQRGFNVVRAELYQDGELRWYSASQLKEYGETWFPERVDFYVAGKSTPVVSRRVQRARFNDPDLPERLTIKQLDLEPGVSLNVWDPERNRANLMVWSGQDIVTPQQWLEMMKAGTVEPGPTVKMRGAWDSEPTAAPSRSRAADADALPGEATSSADHRSRRPTPAIEEPQPGAAGNVASTSQPAPRTQEHPWEKYTREFIERYKLNEEQSQRAWTICKECRSLADTYLAKCAAKLADVDRRTAELRKSEEREIAKRLLTLEEERRKLMQPIDDIFEQQLKPRLDKLPTRAQRKAAEPAASQPVREKRTTEHP